MIKSSVVTRIIERSLFFIYILIVLFLSLYSFSNSDIRISPRIFGVESDKVIHFMMYLPFPFLARFSLKCRKYPIIFAAGIIISAVAELLQHLVPERSFELYDLVANFSAILAGTVFVYALDKIIFKRDDRPGRLQ